LGKIDSSKLPGHIAIIMDGNGRWAKKRRLPKIFGHREGAKAVDRITEASRELGVKALTLYSFSTENWKRPGKEVNALMNLLYDYLDKKYQKLQKNNIRLNAIGKLEELPGKVKLRLSDVMEKTRQNNGMVLTLALNYGGRQEIVEAAKKLLSESEKEKISIGDINEELFEKFLFTRDLPDVDLVIRTSGERRISNFLLWQISYSEIYITDRLWPDFSKKDLEIAIGDYRSRERRYGG